MIYEDDTLVSFLAEQPATIGHIILAPKRHTPILEGIDERESDSLALACKKMSIALFEAIKCEGTNIIISNGIEAGQEEPHVSASIIARKEGDGLMFEWAPKRLSEEEMSTVELQLKQELEKPEVQTEIPKEKPAEDKPEKEVSGDEDIPDAIKEKEESYLIKQLRRMP
ncbi:HIT family protein [Candidatus Woesearchaeota archaeon]|nr:HIT family protein [Candidatus Woesearchaeota archaeon]